MPIEFDLDIDKYHASSGISKSGLDDIAISPAHYFAGHLDPRRPPRKETSAQLHGNLAHCAILEPDLFVKRYVVGPDVNKNTNIWKDFVKLHADKTVIDPQQHATAWRQADSVCALKPVRDALDNGKAEVSATWTDAETGVLCRCRPDWVTTSSAGAMLLDVKTYSSAASAQFELQVARMRYHVQAAWYSEGYAIAAGVGVFGFLFVAVEDSWPFAASVMMLDDESVEVGRKLAHENLRTYAACSATNLWPGYGEDVKLIRLPAWAMKGTE